MESKTSVRLLPDNEITEARKKGNWIKITIDFGDEVEKKEMSHTEYEAVLKKKMDDFKHAAIHPFLTAIYEIQRLKAEKNPHEKMIPQTEFETGPCGQCGCDQYFCCHVITPACYSCFHTC